MLKDNKAFTLAEVMVTMAVFGILVALVLPAVANIRPNKSKALFKKAYYTAERMVFELVNDEDFYPTTGDEIGFSNTVVASYLGHSYGGDNDADAKKKFCSLFARKVNTLSDEIKCDASHQSPLGDGYFKEPAFITTDGIAWYMPITKFDKTGNDIAESIYVDVNNNQEPNCQYDEKNPSKCKNPDIFEIKVEPDGKMSISGTKEKEYLQANNSVK